ncbi:unnamed protein product [marine sediment metagenome]|uniref:Uncharacterized protein n=1 Tax=marine sediment metagenome TaxID=412755 RepID=X1SPI8_9ZZZZ
MHCPRCGIELTIYEEKMGIKWLYRFYPCPKCAVVWDWKSKIRGGENYWQLSECKAWDAVGIPIIKDYYDKHSQENSGDGL